MGCLECGARLTNNQTQFCSDQCRREQHPSCVNCDIPLVGAQTKYCSLQCRRQDHSSLKYNPERDRSRQEWHKNNPGYATESSSKAAQKVQQFKIAYVLEQTCPICDRVPNDPCWHHLDPITKVRTISACRTKKKFLDEVNKCICLCRKCHIGLHKCLVTTDEVIELARDRLQFAPLFLDKKAQRVYHGAPGHAMEVAQSSTCVVCGATPPTRPNWHHLDPRTKIDDVTSISNLEDVKREIEKCICICKKCHWAVHKSLITTPEIITKTKELMI